MKKINGIEKRTIESLAREIREATANTVWTYNRNLIETSLDTLITIDKNGIITDANTSTENFTGVPKEKIVGTDFSIYFTEPDKARDLYRKVFENVNVLDYELYFKHVNGLSIPVLYNASVYKDDKGQVIGVFATARDISAIKKYEKELIKFQNNLELLVKQKTKELIIANEELVFQNDEKEKRAAELAIANKELVFQNDEKEKRAAELAIANKELVFQNDEKEKRAAELAIANKELVFQNDEKEKRAAELAIANKELVYQNDEKEKRAAELVIANKELVFQNDEKEKRAAELAIANKELVFQNNEKEKRAAELVLQKEKVEILNNELEFRVSERTAQLQSINMELEALSYSISHDLKAPLRHITGYIALLEKKYSSLFPEEGREYIDYVSSAAINMGELINGLLQFSRTGRIEMNQERLDMNEIVNTLIQPFKEQDTENKIEFKMESMPDAFGDLEMINSVWSNLIENAVKFSKKKN
jgi:PAS domain S-box-containing protein